MYQSFFCQAFQEILRGMKVCKMRKMISKSKYLIKNRKEKITTYLT